MRALPLVVFLGLSVCLIAVWSGPGSGAVAPKKAATPAATEAPGGADGPPAEETTPAGKGAGQPADQPQQSRIEKEVSAAEAKLMTVQTQEMTLSTNLMAAQLQANQLVADPGRINEKFAKGTITPGMAQYKQVMLRCAQQYASLDNQVLTILKSLKALDRERDAAPAEMQARLEAIVAKYQAKHRSCLERLGELYDRVGEFRLALQAYLAVFQMIPEKDRAKERKLIEKIASLYEHCGDFRNALGFYRIIWDATAERDRIRDGQLCDRLCNMLDKTGDFQDELALYRQRLDNTTDGNARKGFQDRITALEKKLGISAKGPATTPAPTGGGKRYW